MQEAASGLPGWVFVLGGFLGVFAASFYSYIKKSRPGGGGNDVTVLSASFSDRATTDHLSDALDRNTKAQHDASDEVRKLRQAIETNTDTQINLLRFMDRREP